MLTYERYAEYRDALDLTDYKISHLCGIAQSTLSEWKRGKYTPKIDKMVKIAECLGIPIEEVLT